MTDAPTLEDAAAPCAACLKAEDFEMDARHRYTCPGCGKVYLSVTTILGNAVPKDLSWWGMTVGAFGVRQLVKLGVNVKGMDSGELTKALQSKRLTVRDKLSDGATRGTAVHDAAERYANEGVVPVASQFPEAQRGYIRGFAKFVTTYHPEFLETEVKVVSPRHQFAGTFDFTARIRAKLVTVKRPRARRTIMLLNPDPSSTLTIRGDYKTSKWVYPASHFAQLEAYEGAALEAGGTASDCRAVVHLAADGRMELVPATSVRGGVLRLSSFDDFLALKASAESISGMESSYQRPPK